MTHCHGVIIFESCGTKAQGHDSIGTVTLPKLHGKCYYIIDFSKSNGYFNRSMLLYLSLEALLKIYPKFTQNLPKIYPKFTL